MSILSNIEWVTADGGSMGIYCGVHVHMVNRSSYSSQSLESDICFMFPSYLRSKNTELTSHNQETS